MAKTVTREELWDLRYRKRANLRHATEEQLRDRLFDIINNLRTLTLHNKIGLLPHDTGGEFWMSRFSHVLEELGSRGRGVPVISDYAYELEGICDSIPDVESRLTKLSKAPLLFKIFETEIQRGSLKEWLYPHITSIGIRR